MKILKPCCSLIFLTVLIVGQGFGQEKPVELMLIDTLSYTSFSTRHIPDARYPISNLFDQNKNTCWVSQINEKVSPPVALIELPEQLPANPALIIYPGYWKSKRLYRQNARPKKLRIKYYYGLIGDGFVSEIGYMALSYEIPVTQVIDLEDSLKVQTVPLNEKLMDKGYTDSLETKFSEEVGIPVLTTRKIISLEILEAYPGSKYNDICISEVLFNDCYIFKNPSEAITITNVYVNEDENSLLFDTPDKKKVLAYQQEDVVIQLLELSKDQRWAIILTMPSEVGERAETSYEVIDLVSGKSISTSLRQQFKTLVPGAELWFEESEGQLYLKQTSLNEEVRIRFREMN